MSKIPNKSRNDIVIEGHTAKWNIALLGEINGTYAGEFTFRCFLSPTQQISANREYRELLGANPTLAPEHESFLAYALTQLKYRVISAPPFWSATVQLNGMPGDVLDQEVISEVLDAAIESQKKYKDQMQARKIEMLEKAKAAAEKLINGQEDEPEDDFEDEE